MMNTNQMLTLRAKAVVGGISVGILFTPILALLALSSVGKDDTTSLEALKLLPKTMLLGDCGTIARGGDEAKFFFPYTMLLMTKMGNRIGWPLIVMSLIQYPTYGAIIGFTGIRCWMVILVGIVLLVAHSVAVCLCHSGSFVRY